MTTREREGDPLPDSLLAEKKCTLDKLSII